MPATTDDDVLLTTVDVAKSSSPIHLAQMQEVTNIHSSLGRDFPKMTETRTSPRRNHSLAELLTDKSSSIHNLTENNPARIVVIISLEQELQNRHNQSPLTTRAQILTK